jgi:hypothetical protein
MLSFYKNKKCPAECNPSTRHFHTDGGKYSIFTVSHPVFIVNILQKENTGYKPTKAGTSFLTKLADPG